jgi:hypothetical protein
MMDPQGNTISVDVTAVVDRRIRPGSLMWIGCVDDLNLVGTAFAGAGAEPRAFYPDRGIHEVKAYNETKDVRGRERRHTVGLMRWRDRFPAAKPVLVQVSLATSPNPLAFGATLTLTATVTGPLSPSGFLPTGSLFFRDGETIIGRVGIVGGIGVLAYVGLGRGGHSLTAEYQGDQFYGGNRSSELSQMVV